MSGSHPISQRSGPELTVTELYSLLELRERVFVVEQECPYAEIDGADLLPTTVHLWAEESGQISSCIRLLDFGLNDGTPCRIGRVATSADSRGKGLAGHIMRQGLALIGDSPSKLDAQTYLVDFYAGFGFERSGPDYVEDGIPHTPMTRAPSLR